MSRAFPRCECRSPGRTGGLDRVGCNGHFVHTRALGRSVDVNLRRWLRLGTVRFVVVVLDVIPGDLKVAHLRPLQPNASQPIVANVAAGNVNLVQVYPIEIHTHTGVKVNVTVADEHVAVALDEMNAVPTMRDHHALEHGLHRLDQFKSIGLRVRTFHLDIANRRQPLMRGHVTLTTTRITRTTMSAHQSKRRPRASHHHLR